MIDPEELNREIQRREEAEEELYRTQVWPLVPMADVEEWLRLAKKESAGHVLTDKEERIFETIHTRVEAIKEALEAGKEPPDYGECVYQAYLKARRSAGHE